MGVVLARGETIEAALLTAKRASENVSIKL
jgi:formate-dependent phosphoribosylglycinamide formyltransferase (GAR transformylase)